MEEASALYDDFADFIKNHDKPTGECPLEEFILEWLEYGDAVIESGGNFGTYLKGVIVIIARWLEDPSILDFTGSASEPARRRRAVGVMQPGRSDELSFDRDYFHTIRMRRLVRRRE